jgi:8-oxo-dGTP diphosphatase
MTVRRFVGVILINSKGNVLLQLRSKNEIHYPNHWTLPGGRVEENETVTEALRREINEELGIDLASYRLFTRVKEREDNSMMERYIYWSNLDRRTENLTLGEGIALQYFSQAEITSLKIAFNLRGIIESFLEETSYNSKRLI